MKSKLAWISIMVFGVILIGLPAIYAADMQPEPADSTYQEAMDDQIPVLEEIEANREAVIEELVQMWFVDIPDWEVEFRSLLNLSNDSKLLAILNAKSYAEVQAILGGGTPAFYSADSMADPFTLGDTDKDFVYTPVNPCRIVDTRIAGGSITSGGSRSFYVHGGGGAMAPQGGNPAGCPSPRGEPRAVHMNIVAVNSVASGFLTVWPTGTGRPLAGILNYFPGRTDPVSNAFTVKTGFAMGRDINVYAHRTTDVVADVMGYYYDVDDDNLTKYLALAGAQCNHPPNAPSGIAHYNFYCDLSDSVTNSKAYWGVNVPNGATLRGMRVYLWTGAGTTTCRLYYGNNNFGAVIGTVTDSTSGWHSTSEATFTHSVNTANNAYAVECSNPTAGDNVIGWIRIRYTGKYPH